MNELQLPEETLNYNVKGLKGINRRKPLTTEDLDDYRIQLLKQAQTQISAKSPMQSEEFGKSVYDENIGGVVATINPTAARSNEQSGLLKFTNAVGSGVASGLLTAVETLGYIGDLTEHFDLREKSDRVKTNPISGMMKELKNDLYYAMPMYEDPANV